MAAIDDLPFRSRAIAADAARRLAEEGPPSHLATQVDHLLRISAFSETDAFFDASLEARRRGGVSFQEGLEALRQNLAVSATTPGAEQEQAVRAALDQLISTASTVRRKWTEVEREILRPAQGLRRLLEAPGGIEAFQDAFSLLGFQRFQRLDLHDLEQPLNSVERYGYGDAVLVLGADGTTQQGQVVKVWKDGLDVEVPGGEVHRLSQQALLEANPFRIGDQFDWHGGSYWVVGADSSGQLQVVRRGEGAVTALSRPQIQELASELAYRTHMRGSSTLRSYGGRVMTAPEMIRAQPLEVGIYSDAGVNYPTANEDAVRAGFFGKTGWMVVADHAGGLAKVDGSPGYAAEVATRIAEEGIQRIETEGLTREEEIFSVLDGVAQAAHEELVAFNLA